MMHKRKLVTHGVVGMAMLLMGVSALGILANDGSSSATDATTPPAASATKTSASANDQITALKQQMALQQKQIEQMQKTLEQQKQLLEQLTKPAPATEQAAQPAPPAQPAKPAVLTEQAAQSHSSSLGEVASTSPVIPQSQKKVENAIAPLGAGIATMSPARPAVAGANTESSPLQLHIGSASLTPVGFMDFTSVWRNHAAGGNIGTSFGSVPYGTITNGLTPYTTNLSEFRFSMQNSRIGFRADADVMGAHVIGYMEADFLGTPASLNIAVTSNSNLLRSRLYWVDVRKGSWEILGGQTWSLLTPGRVGISPIPGDLFYSQDIDVNYQAGLFWGRIPELRFVYHPSKQVAFAVALDSPDQYGGGSSGGGSVVLPSALSATSAYAGELDFGASSGGIATPNVAPDVIAKLAFDPNKRVHVEIGGVERNFKLYYPGAAAVAATSTTPAIAAIPSSDFSAEGGGGFANLHVEIAKGFRLLTNNFWSDGGGRYIFGQAPDLIAHADGSLSLVHSGSTVTGFEFTQKKTMIYGYYGGIYVMRNTAVDSTGKYIGYGYTGASAGQNRAIQEATVGFNQTIWKDAKWGAVNFMGQYSYLTRAPWYVASGQPLNANINMLFFNLRYTLPGSAPTMGK
ncbi:MAG TPA: hypothetical protein VKO18_18985 [Terriglobia bacterium]|nr:hypothetical protein [Terriglobia bacterium]